MGRLITMIRKLKPSDPDRIKMTQVLLEKLHSMGLTNNTQSLEDAVDISAAHFCRRRFPVVLTRMKFCTTLTEAVTFIKQGHFRIGPHVVSNDCIHITRDMEDHITWAEGSKMKQKVRE